MPGAEVAARLDPAVDARIDWGQDAPGLMRGFLAGGGAALAGAIGLCLAGHGWLSVPLWLAAAYGLWMGGAMRRASRVGKRRTRDAMLDLVPWQGDEAVLDLGCGRGLLLVGAAARVPRGRAVGVDLWRAVDQAGNGAAAALAHAAAAGVAERVTVETADMRALPFADADFDAVLSHWAVHNIETEAGRLQALAEAGRVLRPGGWLLLADIAHRDAYVAALGRLGFAPVAVRPVTRFDRVMGVLSGGSFRPALIAARKA